MIFIPKLKDLTGKRFGEWTVIKRIENYTTPSGNTFTQWLCQCNCGSEPRGVLANTLLSGKSTSCGCVQKNIAATFCKSHFSTHKESKTRLYKIWAGIRKRCTNPHAYNYKDYGGRGITICDEWDNFECFMKWSIENGYNDELSIDRIDVNGNYTPNNCRWVTRVVQANNRRGTIFYEINGISMSLADWIRKYNLNYKRTYKQIKAGKALEDIIKLT